MYLVFIVVMTIMIHIVVENNKIENIFNLIYDVDSEIEVELKKYIDDHDVIDIYGVKEIRSMLKRKFIDSHKLDEFKIYKESMYKISVILRLGLAVQTLEIITNKAKFQLEEVSMEYSHINFSKK